MASRSLQDLQPAFAEKAGRVLRRCEELGVKLVVTCTWRTNSEQAKLYAQGRTAPGKVVTWANAGQSPHNYGLAMDVVPVRDGKAIWDASDEAWKIYGQVVRSEGLEWAGDWVKKKREMPHCQMPEWRTLVEAGRVTLKDAQ